MTGKPVIVVAYDPAWPALFEELAAPIRAALGDLALSVEHVGSTSVPGLAAKPVIDMDVVVAPGDVGEGVRRLAREFHHDIDGYIQGKTDFLVGILRKAGFDADALAEVERLNARG